MTQGPKVNKGTYQAAHSKGIKAKPQELGIKDLSSGEVNLSVHLSVFV